MSKRVRSIALVKTAVRAIWKTRRACVNVRRMGIVGLDSSARHCRRGFAFVSVLQNHAKSLVETAFVRLVVEKTAILVRLIVDARRDLSAIEDFVERARFVVMGHAKPRRAKIAAIATRTVVVGLALCVTITSALRRSVVMVIVVPNAGKIVRLVWLIASAKQAKFARLACAPLTLVETAHAKPTKAKIARLVPKIVVARGILPASRGFVRESSRVCAVMACVKWHSAKPALRALLIVVAKTSRSA